MFKQKKKRLRDVAPQLPYTEPFKRGDHVAWAEYRLVLNWDKDGKALPPTRRKYIRLGRILAKQGGGYWVKCFAGGGTKGRSYVYSVELSIVDRPERSDKARIRGLDLFR